MPGVALSALSVIRSRASLVDGVVAAVLSAAALAALPRSSGAGAVLLAVICALAATTTVAWRSRAPEAAVIVAGAGAVGEWLTATHTEWPGSPL